MRVQPAPAIVTEITPHALAWTRTARRALAAEDTPLLRSALETNFGISRAERPAAIRDFVAQHFAAIERVILDGDRLFRAPWPWDVRRWFGTKVPPAYTFEGYVYFTDEFRYVSGERGFGPKCLTAMLVHECVHVFDDRSGEGPIHISEWDERFDSIPPLLQVHNPSAYASFAAQVHHEEMEWPREKRFGAGRRHD